MEEITVINLADKTEYSIKLNSSGENAQTCPVCSPHRKNKTGKCFSFNGHKRAGRCNHCQVVLVEKKEFKKKEQEKVYTRPLFKKTTTYSQDVIDFFTARKISEKTLLEFRVGEGIEWMPKAQGQINTIQFNYFRDGELVNIKYRGKGKDFKMVKDAELIFYNLDCAINFEEIIIVEGEPDCLAMAEAGYKNVVSVPNGAGLGKINFDFLDNSIDAFSEKTKFVIAVDNDKPGLNLQAELVRRLGPENCTRVIFMGGCKDANECLVEHGIQGIIESMQGKTEFPIEGVFTAFDFIDEIYNLYNNGLPKGCGIGNFEFDEHIKFHEGYLTIITGIPSAGKSEFLDFVLCKLNIHASWKVGLFSPENYPMWLHFSKFAEKVTGKPFEGVQRMSKEEMDEMVDYHTRNFYFIKPTEDFTLDNILATVKSLVRRKGIRCFVIDAWNKIDHQYTTTETKYISEQLDKITNFCERNLVHCFLVAHPYKITKDKTTGMFEVPNLYSISGSANFYNKASVGITVYRNTQNHTTEVYIQKVRFKHWGKVGSVVFNWDRMNGRYYQGQPTYENWISGELPSKKIEQEYFNYDNNPLSDNPF